MAQDAFQKLRLDTQAPASYRNIPCTFSSLVQQQENDHGHDYEHQPELELSPHSAFEVRGGRVDRSEEARRLLLQQQNLDQESGGQETSGSTSSPPWEERGTSISFNPRVQLEDGDHHALDQPLPKPLPIPNARNKRRLRSNSESEKGGFDSVTGEALADVKSHLPLMYHRGEMRHPLLQTTVDDLATRNGERLEDYDKVASLTSATTVSPVAEEVVTPINDFLLSPITSSPIEISPRSTGRRSVSQRSFGSGGSVGRRRNTKSATSSINSPAGAFLSQWSTKGTDAMPQLEPDDEGQEIGDHSGYIIGRQIGYGGFSVVKEVFTMDGDRRVVGAVKIVRKQVRGRNEQENDQVQTDFEREVSVWRYLRHKYILPLIAVYDTSFATFCITHLNKGGTLFDLLRSRRSMSVGKRGLPARLAKRYIYQLGSAIRYLHEDVRVVHRDIKPENCLIDVSMPKAKAEGGNILLCDFGMADFIHNENRSSPEVTVVDDARNIGPSENSTSVMGSLQYSAPELIGAGETVYSTAADIWAYGCVMYALLTGDLPFQHGFQPRLVMMITRGEYDLKLLEDCPAVRETSLHAARLVQDCLAIEPEERLSISQVLESEWLLGCEELYEDAEPKWS